MGNWKKPGRAERVVIYEEGGVPRQYFRGTDAAGDSLWREDAETPGVKASGGALSTEELLRAIEASLLERRRAGRGLKFRL
jgi:hypothetical protein